MAEDPLDLEYTRYWEFGMSLIWRGDPRMLGDAVPMMGALETAGTMACCFVLASAVGLPRGETCRRTDG